MSVLALLLSLALGAATPARAASSSVVYNHQKHIDLGMKCLSCHIGADLQEKASIPNVKACALCHIPGKDSPKTSPALGDAIKSGVDIKWPRVYRAARHVRFSHRRHVAGGGIACAACHGAIEKETVTIHRQAVRLEMATCRSCHMKEKVNTDCLACHR